MSRTPARHRKPPRAAPARASLIPRHRKPSPIASALQNKPVRVAAAVAGSALIVSAWPATSHVTAGAPHAAGAGQAGALDLAGAAGQLGPAAGRHTAGAGAHAIRQHRAPGTAEALARYRARHRKPAHARHRPTPPPVYLNPFRDVSGLVPERIDMGADFSGTGPVYALGDAVITNATAGSGGWPGGGWITYQLTSGPDAGLMVYVAEDVTPTVQAGQHVSSSTVIANMFAGGDGIETGWAQPSGLSAESQLPVAGGISGNGPFPTRVGLSFEELLQSAGVAAGNNRDQSPYGLLPPNYPAG